MDTGDPLEFWFQQRWFCNDHSRSGFVLWVVWYVRKNVPSTMMFSLSAAILVSLIWVIAGYSLASSGTGAYFGDLSKAFLNGVVSDALRNYSRKPVCYFSNPLPLLLLRLLALNCRPYEIFQYSWRLLQFG